MDLSYSELSRLLFESRRLQEDIIFYYEGRLADKRLPERHFELYERKIQQRKERLEEVDLLIKKLEEHKMEVRYEKY